MVLGKVYSCVILSHEGPAENVGLLFSDEITKREMTMYADELTIKYEITKRAYSPFLMHKKEVKQYG